MKKTLILATVLVLTLSMLTGCGCTRQNAGMDTRPSTEMTILPTNIPETTAPLLPETQPATTPMTEAPTEAPTDDATGTGSTADTNEAASEEARNRMR